MSLVTDLFGRLRKEIQLVAKAINELFLSGPQPSEELGPAHAPSNRRMKANAAVRVKGNDEAAADEQLTNLASGRSHSAIQARGSVEEAIEPLIDQLPICIAGGCTPFFRWAPYSVRTFLVGLSA